MAPQADPSQEQEHALQDTQRPWPFSRATLMAGLRRYLDAPHLRLLEIKAAPLPNVTPGSLSHGSAQLRGMIVGVEIGEAVHHLALVLKEAPVSERGRVLSAIGKREHGVYKQLAPHLPVLVPGLVAGDPSEGWIVLEAMTGLRPPEAWTRDDYVEAITGLAAIHDRFWDLGEDLAIFPWLARPMDTDYVETVVAAAEAVNRLVREERIPPLATARNFLFFGALVQQADEIVGLLRQETLTLLHGDYWPGNIARPLDGRQIVFDWQRASIGPAVLDLVLFINSVDMMLEPALSLDEARALYREEMARRVNPPWDDKHFARLWDHAMLWGFLTYWLGRLGTMSLEDYDLLPPRFERVWLHPATEILGRRFGVRLPE